MATCTHCSSPLPADASFCPSCASPVTSNASSPAPAVNSPGTLSGLKTELETPDALSQTTQLAAGSEFHNRYSVQRLLGAGAMGMVYLAEDQLTQRQVALKLINPALVNSPSVAQRFLREGLTARDIRHPNVIAMYDVGDDGGQLYLVMEYLPGDTLRDWLHRFIQNHVDVPFATARSIIVKILEGLTAAHQSGVIHRDLKPENIMLLGDPQHDADYQLKILDFGIARAIDTTSNTQLTSSGAATGTPLYMAPEQRTAADTVGPAADLYAVSMIFYELLMGVPATGILGQPAKERGDIPTAVDSILEKGLSSRPRSRFQSTQDYLTALQALDTAAPQKPEPKSDPRPEPKP
ncbi:MAG: protein kinase, partial [Candidatus Competibacteraceae bacterium]|nr:protein kinase [Candidatus Competibacteraceae bacterium]